MVDFGVVEDKSMAGYVTGVANLFYMFSLAISSPFWCRLSDRIGRKPCMLVSQGFSLILSVLLAFTNNYYFFIAIRTVNGFVAGNLSVVKIALGEISKNERVMVVAWSIFNTFGCLSTVMGGLTGGFLARPLQQYPSLSIWDNTPLKDLFSTFPLFATFLACGFLELIGFIASLFLKETNSRITVFEKPVSDRTPSDEELIERVEREEEERSQRTISFGSIKQSILSFFKSEVFKKEPFLMLVAFFLVVNAGALFAQTLPVLFSISEEDGGFNMTNYEISIVNSWVMGICSILVCLVLCPILLNLVRPVWILRLAPVALAIPLCLYPEVNYVLSLPNGRTWMWVLLIVLTLYRSTCEITFTNVLVLSSNSVTDAGRGTYQAVMNCLGFIGKGIGPYVGGSLLSLGIKVNTFPLDIHTGLIIGALAYVIIGIIGIFLPLELEIPAESRIAKEEAEVEMEMKMVEGSGSIGKSEWEKEGDERGNGKGADEGDVQDNMMFRTPDAEDRL